MRGDDHGACVRAVGAIHVRDIADWIGIFERDFV
jgi:hypothetical protein